MLTTVVIVVTPEKSTIVTTGWCWSDEEKVSESTLATI